MKKNIEDYVNSLSPDEKSGDGLYSHRLRLCSGCPKFHEGLCRICGCFVQARAAKKNSYCPDVNRRW